MKYYKLIERKDDKAAKQPSLNLYKQNNSTNIKDQSLTLIKIMAKNVRKLQ